MGPAAMEFTRNVLLKYKYVNMASGSESRMANIIALNGTNFPTRKVQGENGPYEGL